MSTTPGSTSHELPERAPRREARVLTLNGGSSSIKFALFEPGEPPLRIRSGAVERVGTPECRLRATGRNQPDIRRPLLATDLTEAVAGVLDWLTEIDELHLVTAIGHRIVHGGPVHTEPQIITPELLADLRDVTSLAPAHLPAEIQLIEALLQRLPGVPQFACFDTAFHRDLPLPARLLPIPRHYAQTGVRRYGFHGLSYTYLLGEYKRLAGAAAATGRIVLAHLGSGASLAAVCGGRCIDTTMGMTPAGGLVMGTRTGDIDPGLLVYLARTGSLSAEELDDLVTRRSGLLGISETTADMRELLDQQATDPRAADAVEIFCYQARKWIGALAAAMGGLEAIVFSGGIGEFAPEVRARICSGLGFLGVLIDSPANNANASTISAADSTVSVRVIPTDEELMIARTVFQLRGSAAQP